MENKESANSILNLPSAQVSNNNLFVPQPQPQPQLSLFKRAKAQVIRLNRHIGKHLIRTVFIVIVILVLINSFMFYYVEKYKWYNTKPSDSKTDAFVNGLYFTSTTMTTIGYGDITPQTNGAKLFVVFMEAMALFLGMRLFDTAVQMRV